MKLKVQNNPGLVRDSRSKAIVTEDKERFKNYIQERNFRMSMHEVKQDVDLLRSEIHEIKGILNLIMNRVVK